MSVARAYAKAVFEVAIEAKAGAQELDALEGQVAQLDELIKSSKEARVALLTPALTSKEKAAFVAELAKRAQFSTGFVRFLVLLANKERFPIFSEIRKALREVRLEAEGGMLGELVSADAVVQGDIDDLARAFSKKLGKKVSFQVSTDPSLLAGMKITVNGVTYDGTLRSRLQQLRDRLVYGSSATH